MKRLGEYINNNEYLKELNVSATQLVDQYLEVFLPYIFGNSTLTKLDLSGNGKITQGSMPYLLEAVKTTNLTTIDLSYTSLFHQDQQDIYTLLKTPLSERDVPIKSNTKSAAKISST